MNEQSYMTQVPDFQAKDLASLDSQTNALVHSYRALTNDLLKHLRDGNLSAERKVYAIYLLGQLRAASAATLLIDNIDLKASKLDHDGIGRWGPYPAQEALTKIGTTAVNMVLDKLSFEKNELRRQLMCSVISDAVGNKAGEVMLKLRHDEEKALSHRANLEAAIRVMSKL